MSYTPILPKKTPFLIASQSDMENELMLELYHAHYGDTYELSGAAQGRRNRNFVILCALEAISFMLIYNPTLICGVLSETIRAKVESTIVLSNMVL